MARLGSAGGVHRARQGGPKRRGSSDVLDLDGTAATGRRDSLAGVDADRFNTSWHEAAERATFDLYEPDTDQYRWTGGYDSHSVHISIRGLVDDHITHVETWADAPGLDDDVLRQVSTIQLEMRHRAESGGDAPDDPPVLDPDERLVTVGEDAYRCAGRRLVGVTNLWAGHIGIDGLYVQICTTSPADEIAIRICTDAHALTRTPPRHR